MPTARRSRALCLAVAAAALVGVAGCGEEEEDLEVPEGEPVELAEVRYNVVLTRTLNPGDVEDADYLEGAPPPAADEVYLGTFLQIHNESDADTRVPADFTVLDTQGTEYEPIENESPFALEFESVIPPGGEIPEVDTIPRYGPIEGSLVLFLIDDAATENRPLELEIPSTSGEVGVVELDI